MGGSCLFFKHMVLPPNHEHVGQTLRLEEGREVEAWVPCVLRSQAWQGCLTPPLAWQQAPPLRGEDRSCLQGEGQGL